MTGSRGTAWRAMEFNAELRRAVACVIGHESATIGHGELFYAQVEVNGGGHPRIVSCQMVVCNHEFIPLAVVPLGIATSKRQ